MDDSRNVLQTPSDSPELRVELTPSQAKKPFDSRSFYALRNEVRGLAESRIVRRDRYLGERMVGTYFCSECRLAQVPADPRPHLDWCLVGKVLELLDTLDAKEYPKVDLGVGGTNHSGKIVVCQYCGLDCQGGAEHFARVEDLAIALEKEHTAQASNGGAR